MFLRLLLLFTVVPLVELFLLVKLGTVIGMMGAFAKLGSGMPIYEYEATLKAPLQAS